MTEEIDFRASTKDESIFSKIKQWRPKVRKKPAINKAKSEETILSQVSTKSNTPHKLSIRSTSLSSCSSSSSVENKSRSRSASRIKVSGTRRGFWRRFALSGSKDNLEINEVRKIKSSIQTSYSSDEENYDEPVLLTYKKDNDLEGDTITVFHNYNTPKKEVGHKTSKMDETGLKAKHNRSLSMSLSSDDEEKEFASEVLEAINIYRQAHGVKNLIINLKMEKQAKTWANKLAHQKTIEPSNKKLYGENIFCKKITNPAYNVTAEEVVDLWYAEIQNFEFGKEPNSLMPIAENFSQLVWRDSTEMGSALTRSESGTMVFVVAYFAPPGNVSGQFARKVFPRRDANKAPFSSSSSISSDEFVTSSINRYSQVVNPPSKIDETDAKRISEPIEIEMAIFNIGCERDNTSENMNDSNLSNSSVKHEVATQHKKVMNEIMSQSFLIQDKYCPATNDTTMKIKDFVDAAISESSTNTDTFNKVDWNSEEQEHVFIQKRTLTTFGSDEKDRISSTNNSSCSTLLGLLSFNAKNSETQNEVNESSMLNFIVN